MAGKNTAGQQPSLTLPTWFAFIAFIVFVIWGALPDKPSSWVSVTPAEYKQLELFTLFFIGAMLPSDALIRFGRNLLFSKVDDASKAASDTPKSTLAQKLAFAVFIVVALTMLLSDSWFDQTEAPLIINVARTLVIALLPSDAAIRFGRAIYLKGSLDDGASPTEAQAKRI